MGMMGAMWLWMVLGGLVGLVVVALAAIGVAMLVRRSRAPVDPSGTDEARELLRRRYAAGEMDDDEYLLRLAGLTQR